MSELIDHTQRVGSGNEDNRPAGKLLVGNVFSDYGLVLKTPHVYHTKACSNELCLLFLEVESLYIELFYQLM